jgi:hypothetical protein
MKLALGTGAWLAGCRRSSSEANPPPSESGARYWVQILLSGGHDSLYTTDPKIAKDVDGIVSLPTDNNVSAAGALRFGPHFAPLARWSNDLAIVNGVQVRTANHDTGEKQFFHLKTNIADGRPSALDIIATRRQGQPLGVAYINLASRSMHSPAFFGTADKFYFGAGDVFDQVAQASPAELAKLAALYRKRADEVGRDRAGWTAADQTAIYLRESADFFEHVSTVPPLVSAQRSTDYVAQSMAESIDRTLWLLEHDLCSGVVLDLGLLGWDTHIRNETKQAEMNGHFVTYFNEYMAGLHAKKNRHGVLADRTVTVVGSELGRFPRQNDMLGKDHLPQTSFLFAGPGIRTGRSFGKTGRMMEGLPISYRNADPVASGRVPVLDDIGATMLHLAGVDPERYGYDGEVCHFLLDGVA